MASYLILGAGKFGRLALKRLARQDEAAGFTVVDRDPRALPAVRGLAVSGVETMAAEAAAFIVMLAQVPLGAWLTHWLPNLPRCRSRSSRRFPTGLSYWFPVNLVWPRGLPDS